MTEAELSAIHRAIWRLKAEFFLAVDQKRWEDFAGLFTTDARIDYSQTRRSWGEGAPRQYASAAAFVADVSSMLADAQTVHHGSMPIIDVLAHDHARAIWRMEDVVLRPGDAQRPQGRGFGLYEEEYRLTEAGWRICSLVFTRLLVLNGPQG